MSSVPPPPCVFATTEVVGFDSRWLGAELANSLSWSGRAGSDAVVALLVLAGEAQLEWTDGRVSELPAGRLVWLNLAAGRPASCRLSGDGTGRQVLALGYPLAWVRESLSALRQELSADFRALLLGPFPPHPLLLRPLEPEDRVWARALLAPTLCAAARALLEGSRMSEFFFRKVLLEARGEEHFCTRTRRLALERAARVRELLRQDLENPPSLEELARHCGCHPQYLSRSFSETTGTTISLLLRRLRVERAAELLAAGRMNVSEVALEVGYRSLSHFSQAFRAEKGAPPSRWLREGESKIREA